MVDISILYLKTSLELLLNRGSFAVSETVKVKGHIRPFGVILIQRYEKKRGQGV